MQSVGFIRLSLLVIASLARPAEAGAPDKELSIDTLRTLPRQPRAIWLGYSPDGKWLGLRHFHTEDEHTLIVWKCDDWTSDSWKVPAKLDGNDIATHCVFSQQGARLYYCGSDKLYLRDLHKKVSILVADLGGLRSSREVVHSVAELVDGRTLGLITVDGGSVRVRRLALSEDAKPIELFVKNLGSITAVALSRDAVYLIAGIEVGKDPVEHVLEVWDVRTQKRVFRGVAHEGNISAVSMSPDGRSVISGGLDGRVVIWNTTTGRAVRSYDEKYTVSSIAFHPTGRMFGYTTFDRGGEDNLKIVEPALGQIEGAVAADRLSARRLAFSFDGLSVASVGAEGVVRIWSVRRLTGK